MRFSEMKFSKIQDISSDLIDENMKKNPIKDVLSESVLKFLNIVI